MKPAFLNFASWLLLGPLLASLVLAAPSPSRAQGSADVPPITPDSNTNAPLPQRLKLTPSAQPATLTVGKASYKRGQAIVITFRIVNTSGKPVSYNFATGQRYDITATDSQDAKVWEWARGKLFTQNLSFTTLAPGKSLTYKAAWNGKSNAGHTLAPGSYTLAAHLTSDNRSTVTNGVIVDIDRDPNNMGIPTRTPADTGAVRRVAPAPQVSAKTTVVIK